MTDDPPRRIVVVGAGIAGLTVAEMLRRSGHVGELVLVGGETWPPYDRPPLSKQVLTGTSSLEHLMLRPPEIFDELGIELRLGRPAIALDIAGRTVTLAGGQRLHYDAVVIATGAVPRVLDVLTPSVGVQLLRTVDDAFLLRNRLARSTGLVVVGAGLIGCEVAAAANARGLPVTLVDPAPVPMLRQLGHVVGATAGELHRSRGVRLRMGVAVKEIRGKREVTGVVLTDGMEIAADTVLVAVGSRPGTDWLAGSGLPVDDGIVCDEHGRAAPSVYAIGDVARWEHPALGATLRVEHRTAAVEQAVAVAADIMGRPAPVAWTPYFWTEQYDATIHVHGVIRPGSTADMVAGDRAAGRFLVHYVEDGRLAAVLGWNMPREAAVARERLGKAISKTFR